MAEWVSSLSYVRLSGYHTSAYVMYVWVVIILQLMLRKAEWLSTLCCVRLSGYHISAYGMYGWVVITFTLRKTEWLSSFRLRDIRLGGYRPSAHVTYVWVFIKVPYRRRASHCPDILIQFCIQTGLKFVVHDCFLPHGSLTLSLIHLLLFSVYYFWNPKSMVK
jgi:hypothetical protein